MRPNRRLWLTRQQYLVSKSSLGDGLSKLRGASALQGSTRQGGWQGSLERQPEGNKERKIGHDKKKGAYAPRGTKELTRSCFLWQHCDNIVV